MTTGNFHTELVLVFMITDVSLHLRQAAARMRIVSVRALTSG